mmetsp:Transcript_27288/g.63857  ORF Transcript_27288/g.63857 Transcript_27288/m.63857 type:complete len:238 (-) Transcript_27288:2077-2790(-)
MCGTCVNTVFSMSAMMVSSIFHQEFVIIPSILRIFVTRRHFVIPHNDNGIFIFVGRARNISIVVISCINEAFTLSPGPNSNSIAIDDSSLKHQTTQRIEQISGKNTLERTSTVPDVVALVGEAIDRLGRNIEFHVLTLLQSLGNIIDSNLRDAVHMLTLQSIEMTHLIDSIEQLWTKRMAHNLHHCILYLGLTTSHCIRHVGKNFGAHVGCHHDNTVLEVDNTTVRVGQSAVVKKLE